jgi:hypothetical protein
MDGAADGKREDACKNPLQNSHAYRPFELNGRNDIVRGNDKLPGARLQGLLQRKLVVAMEVRA